MQLDIGTTHFVRDFLHRRIIFTDKYIVHVPIVNNCVNGVVSAFDINNGGIAWSVTYLDNQPDGICKVYLDRKPIRIFYCFNYEKTLHDMAIKCAEFVLT